MINPFDKTFFRLVLGFGLILSFSFASLYFLGKYSGKLEEKQALTSKNIQAQIKK